MDSILDISDFIGEDFEAAGINFFEFAPWTPDYLQLLGELWILDSGDPDPDHALTLVTVMVYMADEADAGLCEALSFNERYRRRTQSTFGMSWAQTRDNGWEPSCGMERLAKYEIAWADYQLQYRHIRPFGFYVEASYMWTVLDRSNMNVEKILSRRRVQPEPATAERTTRYYPRSALSFHLLQYSLHYKLLLLRTRSVHLTHFIILSALHTFLYCARPPHFSTLSLPPTRFFSCALLCLYTSSLRRHSSRLSY